MRLDILQEMGDTLLKKVWDLHTVRQLPTGQTQLFIGLHLVHEVTSPQAFDTLARQRLDGARSSTARSRRSITSCPTRERGRRPFLDVMAEDMMASLERNVRDFGIRFVGLDDIRQGIVHVIGPELGLTQPGMTIACGDSHTSTHGAFGSVAFGIGTSQVRDVLASQCLALEPLKVRRIRVTGTLPKGVYAKDVILDHHPAPRRAGRQRLRLRIRRRRRRAHVDGRADDDLQHVDRGRRARGLREPGRHDGRVRARAGRSRRRPASSTAWRRGGSRWRPTPTRATTTTWRSRPRS